MASNLKTVSSYLIGISLIVVGKIMYIHEVLLMLLPSIPLSVLSCNTIFFFSGVSYLLKLLSLTAV